jgi:hypothetical protein
MSSETLSREGQSTHEQHVHVAAMAAIVQDFTQRDGSVLRDTSALRKRALSAGLNKHEYAAITMLCSKLDAEGSTFLDSFLLAGW